MNPFSLRRFFAGVLAVLVLGTATQAMAGIVTSTGVEIIAPPPSVVDDALTGPVARLFQEHQGIVLPGALSLHTSGTGRSPRGRLPSRAIPGDGRGQLSLARRP